MTTVMDDDRSISDTRTAFAEAFGTDYVPPEDLETIFFVEIREGSYPNPDADPVWTKSSNEQERKQYKHHLSRAEIVVDSAECYRGPNRVCSHGSFTSGDHVKFLKEAWKEEETNRDRICHNCWKKLPGQLKEELTG